MASRTLKSHDCTFNPYTATERYTPSTSNSPAPSTLDCAPEISLESDASVLIYDQPGFPTHAEYKKLESMYYNKLSARKREKALITQSMFDKIWDVLEAPESTQIGTPQFRFWVRKMFHLSDSSTPLRGEEEGQDRSIPVVLHGGKAVAVREQLYDLLCFCHGRAGHAGRDRTCAVIRQHYSWVPKELVALFVKFCPTCDDRKTGISHRSGKLQSPNCNIQEERVHQVENQRVSSGVCESVRDHSWNRNLDLFGEPVNIRAGIALPPLLSHREESVSIYDLEHTDWPSSLRPDVLDHQTYLARIIAQNAALQAEADASSTDPVNFWNYPSPPDCRILNSVSGHADTEADTLQMRSLPSIPLALSSIGDVDSNTLPPLQATLSQTVLNENLKSLDFQSSAISDEIYGSLNQPEQELAKSVVEHRDNQKRGLCRSIDNEAAIYTSMRTSAPAVSFHLVPNRTS